MRSFSSVRIRRPEGDGDYSDNVGDAVAEAERNLSIYTPIAIAYNAPVAEAERNLREKLKGPPLCDRDNISIDPNSAHLTPTYPPIVQ